MEKIRDDKLSFQSIVRNWSFISSIGGLLTIGAGSIYQIRVLSSEVAALRQGLELLPVKLAVMERDKAILDKQVSDHEHRIREIEHRRGR